MRLSQTPADISDHQRRVSDSRRLNLGVGASWMSGSLEPRSEPGENRWSHSAAVTQSYAVGARHAPAWLVEAHAKRDARLAAAKLSSSDVANQIIKDWRAGRIKDTEALIQRIKTGLQLKDRNAALRYYTQLTSRGLLGAQGKWVPVPVPTSTPRYALDTRKTSPSDALNQVVKEWRAGRIRDTEALIQRIRTKLELKDRNAALKYYRHLTSRGLLGAQGKALTASQQQALERQADLEDRLALLRKEKPVTPRLTANQLRTLEQQEESRQFAPTTTPRLSAAQLRAQERREEGRQFAPTTQEEEKKGSRNGIPSAAGDPLEDGEGQDYYYTRQSRTITPAVWPDQRTQNVLAGLVLYWSQGKYPDTDALIADIRKRLGVSEDEGNQLYNTIRTQLKTPAKRVVPAKSSASDRETENMLTGLVLYWSQGKYPDTDALIADIRKRLGVSPTEAERLYKTIQYKLITNPYQAPPKPGQPVQPRQVPQPQTALPAAKTSGGRTAVKKRRTGEADRPHEARILTRWNVQNQGDLTAKASLRLRMGARRILATSMPVDVIAGSRRGLMLQWNIPIDMVLGRHDLSLDIFQSHRADGVKHDKVVATHGVSIDVVEPSGKSAAGNQQQQRDPWDD